MTKNGLHSKVIGCIGFLGVRYLALIYTAGMCSREEGMFMMAIDADFESGNILVEATTESEMVLSIRSDSQASDYQWFYFRATVPPEKLCQYRIKNADGASYPQAWAEYDVLASYDMQDWFRIPTHYNNGHLVWQLQAEQNTVSFAFFVPYSAERREHLLTEAASTTNVKHRSLGKTNEDRDIDCLVFADGESANKKVIWIVSRQHAGEPMAEYASEGLIRRLLNPSDDAAQQLLEQAIIYIVPNMNPDGSALGNLRANAAGADLNRVWHFPSDDAPEVKAVNMTMVQTGCDYFIDIHGDETRPFIWIIPSSLKPELDDIHAKFENYFIEHFPEMGAVPEEIVKDVLPEPGLSINYVTKTYGCPSWVLELPFKETPVGDTLLADGCMKFGEHCIDALLHVME